MAYALINIERGLYGSRGVRAETVWREWRVAEKIPETEDVVSFRLRRVDDRLVKPSLPGRVCRKARCAGRHRPGRAARRRDTPGRFTAAFPAAEWVGARDGV